MTAIPIDPRHIKWVQMEINEVEVEIHAGDHMLGRFSDPGGDWKHDNIFM